MDVTDRQAVQAAVPEVVRRLGGLDALINSAGTAWPGYISNTPDSIWDDMIETNYMGTVNVTRACLPHLRAAGDARIANLSSLLGFMGVFGYGAYAASKFAVVGFSECLRQDVLADGIRVSVVYPPDTDTPQLLQENALKPPETRAITSAVQPLSPEEVANEMLTGMARGQFTIVPGAASKLVHTAGASAAGAGPTPMRLRN